MLKRLLVCVDRVGVAMGAYAQAPKAEPKHRRRRKRRGRHEEAEKAKSSKAKPAHAKAKDAEGQGRHRKRHQVNPRKIAGPALAGLFFGGYPISAYPALAARPGRIVDIGAALVSSGGDLLVNHALDSTAAFKHPIFSAVVRARNSAWVSIRKVCRLYTAECTQAWVPLPCGSAHVPAQRSLLGVLVQYFHNIHAHEGSPRSEAASRGYLDAPCGRVPLRRLHTNPRANMAWLRGSQYQLFCGRVIRCC